MKTKTCELVRRELDERILEETCSTAALDHLRECAACRDFDEKQTKLRQIVGSLGTVAAPADFDFRLRARLANESNSAASHFNFFAVPALRRGFVAAAVLIVFAIGALLVRNSFNHPPIVEQTAKETPPPIHATTPPQEVVTPRTSDTPRRDIVTAANNKRPQGSRIDRGAQVAVRRDRPLATIDSSSIGANVLNANEPGGSSAAFPIDASLQSFKVSLDDGRGNAKTISVPTISFGSQRLMQNANQLTPKRVW